MKALIGVFLILVFSNPFLGAQNSISYDDREISSFMDAVQYGNIDIINDYIQAGVDINAQVGNSTPLICAVERGDIDIVRLLVMSGAEPDSLVLMNNRRGPKKSATEAAIRHPLILEFLIESGADVNLKHNQRKTLLHIATEANSYNTEAQYNSICILLKHKASVNAKDLSGNTPMHFAAMFRNWRSVIALIDSGANVRLENDEGYSSLTYIYMGNDLGILKELVKRQISLSELACGRMFKWNALHHVCMASCDKEIKLQLIKYLIEEQRVNPNQYSTDSDGRCLLVTAFMYALGSQGQYEEDFEVLEYLLENGANINAPAVILNYPKPYTAIGYKGSLSWAIDSRTPQYIIEWMLLHGAR